MTCSVSGLVKTLPMVDVRLDFALAAIDVVPICFMLKLRKERTAGEELQEFATIGHVAPGGQPALGS